MEATAKTKCILIRCTAAWLAEVIWPDREASSASSTLPSVAGTSLGPARRELLTAPSHAQENRQGRPDLGLTPSTTNNLSVKTHFNSFGDVLPPRAELHTAFSLGFCNVEVGLGGCKILIAFNPLNGIESQEAYGLIKV